jgi:ABC-type sugar transport system ATPase subunit
MGNTKLEQVKEKAKEEIELIPDKRTKKNLTVFEKISRNIYIKNGFRFIRNLRKEAARQKAMKVAKDFEKQTRQIEYVPDVPSHAYERELADSFEIYEED